MRARYIPLILSVTATLALPPVIHLDKASITGVSDGSISRYLGIPFAEAPRFDLPKPIKSYNGNINASLYGPACPQQLVVVPPGNPLNLPPITFESEDCLTVNVFVPSGTKTSARLPVAVNIFEGGFEVGNTERSDQLISRIIGKASNISLPMVQVSVNYRVSAYGFLAGKEVANQKLGNIGLFDQRAGLRWVQKYIHAFGGDPSKVVIYGSSAGAISANLQMLGFGGNTENLFRGAFMQSGAILPVGPLKNGQVYYDEIVKGTGCKNSPNTLQCLRHVPFNTLKAAVDNTPNLFDYQSAKLAWLPRIDGVFLEENSFNQLRSGKVPNIPIVSGNCDDEGTLFSLVQSNLTTEADFRSYVKTIWFPTASDKELAPLWKSYTSNPADGSPFGTGDANQLYPQFKRMAAFLGDIVFQSQRRFFLQNLSPRQKKWSYLSKIFKTTPTIGSFHSTDLASNFLDDYLIHFVANLDPNTGSGPVWPQYSAKAPNLFTFNSTDVRYVTQDTYRESGIKTLLDLVMAHPV